jgi:type IV secretion system protein VirB10
MGPAPPLPAGLTTSAGMPGASAPPPESAAKTPGELAFERKLAGPAFARASNEVGSAPVAPIAPMGEPSAFGASRPADDRGDGAQGMSALLRPTVTPAVAASVLPTRRFLLAKGAFIDCTLESAIDSTLPGMTTCITATDTFSADGTVVLLERGTKLVGETRGQVQQGAARIFVLWSEARTPTGVVVPLSSPGTDELGRSGLPGEVNRHFWDRFGAAILLTVVNGAVQGAVNSQNSGSSVIVGPSGTTDVMTEVLRSTANIAPTVTKAQGDRIQVFVARDVDFRSVYALRLANASAPP